MSVLLEGMSEKSQDTGCLPELPKVPKLASGPKVSELKAKVEAEQHALRRLRMCLRDVCNRYGNLCLMHYCCLYLAHWQLYLGAYCLIYLSLNVFCVPIAGYCMTNGLMPSIIQSQMKMHLIIAQLYKTQWTWLPCCSMLIMVTILHVQHSFRTLILLFPMQRHVSCVLGFSIFVRIGSNPISNIYYKRKPCARGSHLVESSEGRCMQPYLRKRRGCFRDFNL